MKWIHHKHGAQVINPLRTDQQPVIYWAKNHLLASLCFSSNTQEMMKRQVYFAVVSSFLGLHEKKPCQELSL